jgi:hypothetical protein
MDHCTILPTKSKAFQASAPTGSMPHLPSIINPFIDIGHLGREGGDGKDRGY